MAGARKGKKAPEDRGNDLRSLCGQPENHEISRSQRNLEVD